MASMTGNQDHDADGQQFFTVPAMLYGNVAGVQK
jgi:hypothetical protein